MKFISKAAMTLLAALAVSGPVRAADLVIVEPPLLPEEIEDAYDWTGPYLGIQGGYGWAELGQVGGFPLFMGQDAIDVNGLFLGGYAGVNVQRDRVVFGIEGDLNKSWLDGGFDAPGGNSGVAEIGWFGSLRARLGYADDRTLWFVTAGGAMAEVTIAVPAVLASETETFTGWTAGLGVEHAFRDNWLVRAEYRYYDFGERTYFGGPNFFGDFDLGMHTVSAGLSYKF